MNSQENAISWWHRLVALSIALISGGAVFALALMILDATSSEPNSVGDAASRVYNQLTNLPQIVLMVFVVDFVPALLIGIYLLRTQKQTKSRFLMAAFLAGLTPALLM